MRFFMTFEADNASKLNDMIYEFCQNNDCEEIQRSTPAMAYCEGYFRVAVTSEFCMKLEEISAE